jgi:hypothetical protein
MDSLRRDEAADPASMGPLVRAFIGVLLDLPGRH